MADSEKLPPVEAALIAFLETTYPNKVVVQRDGEPLTQYALRCARLAGQQDVCGKLRSIYHQFQTDPESR